MNTVTGDTIISGLNWRYATKKFDSTRTIPDDLWSQLEEVLRLTPSSFGLQPWKFFVVKNPELRAKLQGASWGQAQVVEASHLVVFAVKHNLSAADIDKLVTSTSNTRGVPAEKLEGYRNIMLGFVNPMEVEKKDNWSARQVYIALGQFMTAAALMGIDTCPMEGLDPVKYNEILGLNELGYHAVVACPAGYRSADDRNANLAKVRYPLNEVVQHL
jgi:nitroreductase